MAQIYGARLKYLRDRHKNVANDLNILNMASMCGKRLKGKVKSKDKWA